MIQEETKTTKTYKFGLSIQETRKIDLFLDYEHPRGGMKFKPMNLISVGESKLYLVEIFEKHLCFLGLKLWMMDYSFSDSDINKIINKPQ